LTPPASPTAWKTRRPDADAINAIQSAASQWYAQSGAKLQFVAPGTACDPSKNGIYVDDLMIHEFGHARGLNHSTVTSATMYAYMPGYCDTTQMALDPDDIAGIQALYPAGPTLPAAFSKGTRRAGDGGYSAPALSFLGGPRHLQPDRDLHEAFGTDCSVMNESARMAA
jgi:hypothetical protein